MLCINAIVGVGLEVCLVSAMTLFLGSLPVTTDGTCFAKSQTPKLSTIVPGVPVPTRDLPGTPPYPHYLLNDMLR